MKQSDDQMGHFLLRVAWIGVVCLLLWAGFWVATHYLLPFVLGFLIAWLLKPLIVRISALFKIRRKFTGMAVTLLLYLLLAGLLWWTGAALIGQMIRFFRQFPPLVAGAVAGKAAAAVGRVSVPGQPAAGAYGHP